MIYQSCVLFLIALFITYKLSGPSIKIGERFGLIDNFEERKINTRLLVRIGGLSLTIGFLITYIIIIFISEFTNINYPNINNFFLISIFISLSAFILGFIDDIKSLSPFIRLIFQLLIATFIWLIGIRIENIDLSFLNAQIDFISLNKPLSYILSIIWICGLTNAINWLDGLDGLAASIVGIGSLTFGILNINFGNTAVGLILIALSGSCFGFLILNIYPAKLIMGDGGSYFLGFNLGYLSILGSNFDVNLNSSSIEVQKVHIFLFIFVIPLLDMIYVISYRIFKRVSPFYPDNNHLHHRLIKSGLNHKKVVNLIFVSNLLICTSALFIFL